MANADKFLLFYDIGSNWAVENVDFWLAFQTDCAAIAAKVEQAFEQADFMETVLVFQEPQVLFMYRENPGYAQQKFVAGVCDTVCGAA
jgi:hypothetical protein